MVKVNYGDDVLFDLSKRYDERDWRLLPYMQLFWSVEEEYDEERDSSIPPEEGDLRLTYFTIPVEEWAKMLADYEAEKVPYEQAIRGAKVVFFKTFPDAFRLWDDLLSRLKRKEIGSEDVAAALVAASKKYHGEP
jgi:hypothetical protein